MKPKYYPHVTALAALSLLAFPAMLLVIAAHFRSTSSASIDDLVTVDERSEMPTSVADRPESKAASHLTPGENHQTESSVENQPLHASVETQTRGESRPAGSDQSALSKSMFATPPPARTRVAMRPPEDREPTVAIDASPRKVETDDLSDTVAVLDMAMIREEPIPVPEAVPQPQQDASHGSTITASTGSNSAPATAADDMELTAPTVSAPSYFESTGHLSMAGIASKSSGANSGRTERHDRTGKHADAKDPRSDDRRGSPSGSWPGLEQNADAAPEAKIVDVILQQPLEARPVSKVENVVAVSREPGWPIALVKSDLPDDYWWVQQMVGVRGNAFAARVNFGNEDSIPGSVYHMVFVYLDSPDEVRRFRIAKQFRELPEGIRRSRQFTFVRR